MSGVGVHDASLAVPTLSIIWDVACWDAIMNDYCNLTLPLRGRVCTCVSCRGTGGEVVLVGVNGWTIVRRGQIRLLTEVILWWLLPLSHRLMTPQGWRRRGYNIRTGASNEFQRAPTVSVGSVHRRDAGS